MPLVAHIHPQLVSIYSVTETIRILLDLMVTIGGSSFNLLHNIDRNRRNGYISNDSGMRFYKYNV